MRKPVKITLFSLGGLLAVIVIALVAVGQIVFNKDRLTPIVKEYAADYITCETHIGDIDLTFFSTFPNMEICLNDVALINPMEGAVNDTLLSVKRLYAEIDVVDFLKNDQITVTGFSLFNAQANLFVNADSKTNFDVIDLGSTEESDTTSSSALDHLSLHNIEIQQLSASYLNMSTQMDAHCSGVSLSLNTDASMQKMTGGGDIRLLADEVFYSDTLNYASLKHLQLDRCHLFYDGKDAMVNVPKLMIETQEYLLSGDLALLAKIQGMVLDDIDLQWKDNKPSLAGTTALDSAEVTLGNDDVMYLATGPVFVDMPVTSTDERWTTHAQTTVKSLTFAIDSEGTLVDNLDLSTHFVASTDTAFTDLVVSDMRTTAGTQQLDGYVHVNMADTSVLLADVDLDLQGTTLKDVLALVPQAYRSGLKGIEMDARLEATHLVADAEVRDESFVLKHSKVSTSVHDLTYSDDANLSAQFSDLTFQLQYPSGVRGKQIEINSDLKDLAIALQDDTMSLCLNMPLGTVQTWVRDDILEGKDPRMAFKFNLDALDVVLDDTVQTRMTMLKGSADVDMRSIRNCIKLDTKANAESLVASMGASLKGSTGKFGLNLQAVYDEKQQAVLDMLSPEATLSMREGKFQLEGIPYQVYLPSVDAAFNKDEAVFKECQLQMGNSDMALTGTIGHINDYLNNKALLTGNLNLTGKRVDAGQLMDLVSGFGADSIDLAADSMEMTASVVGDTAAADPFMVPKDVNFVVNTNVQTVVFNENNFDKVKGMLTCNDGVLVLEQMGFTSKAADMQLTAIYKSPRRNHLFAGWNFHLLNIDIAEMIRLVPEIDTIVPMLGSFAGKAEFHLAGETSLFADYSPKMSSLKAVAAIEGKDLTVLDSETFATIKKYLFKESTSNKIDTLSVELAVARKKMTLYPMLVGWDKYEAIIAGNHTIVDAMPFNYNISITKCPLVGGHLGLDIQGNLDDIDNISFKLGSCKYANLYRPEKRNVTQSQTLELKKLISTSLKRTVKTE